MFSAWAASLTSCANWKGCDAPTIQAALLNIGVPLLPAMQAFLVWRR